MDIRFAHSLFQALRGDRFAFGYSGAFHDEHTARLIALGEAALEGQDLPANARGRLAFVMVEAYQNIIRHRAELPPQVAHGEGRSFFLLRCQAAGQQVLAFNPIGKGEAERLSAALAHLNTMDRSQLKQLFLAGLQRAGDSRSRGAGLGLIEMARRSGSQLGYLVRGLGPAHDLFVLVVRLGEGMDPDRAIPVGAALHGSTVQHDIRLFQVGLSSPAIDEALLRVMEKDDEEGGSPATGRSQAYLAAMDLMARAAAGAPGVLLLCGAEERAVLTVGRVMPDEAAGRLGRGVHEVRTWDRQRLQRQYRDALLGRDDSGLPLGLIELARSSPEPLHFASFPVAGGVLALVQAVV